VGVSPREGGYIPVKLNRSGEDYLKTILILEGQNDSVRSVDVAEYLHFSKPSVSNAIKLLQEGGYLTMDRSKLLRLTPLGRSVAESVVRRHSVLLEALLAIGVTPETAERDACEIEHALSEESFLCVTDFLSRRGGPRDPA
jgi:Mn-dependent DtxR family transcriptional regulator